MAHDLYQSLQRASARDRQERQVLFAAGAGEGRHRQDLAAAGLDPHRAGIGAAQLRRQEDHRASTCASSPAGSPRPQRTDEIPFVVARIVLQDFTGVPLLADLAAMRGVAQRMGKDPKMIEPLVPVDLVVDHSVQVDYYGTQERARPEHEDGVPAQPRALPVHEVGHAGLRHLQGRAAGHRHRAPGEPRIPGARRARQGTASTTRTRWSAPTHTTMINGIGVVGWGVGGIEAEAGMLGQPVYFLTPDVVGVHLTGRLRGGRDRDRPRADRHRDAAQGTRSSASSSNSSAKAPQSLPVPDRATIGNMAPEYGATMGFFPVDDKTVDYLEATPGARRQEIDGFRGLLQGAGPVRHARGRRRSTTRRRSISTSARSCQPRRPEAAAGPHRAAEDEGSFNALFSKPVARTASTSRRQALRRIDQAASARRHTAERRRAAPAQQRSAPRRGGDGRQPPTPDRVPPTHAKPVDIGNGDVLIAAITSCTNTSNPGVLLAAGLLAKKAVEPRA